MFSFKTYKKYIIKTIIPPLSIITFVLTSVILITQALRLIYLIDKGIELKKFIEFIILIIPSLSFMLLPVISLISVIYVYNRMQYERQILIFRSSGLSDFDIAKPALFLATIVTIISYFISAYLMPLSYNKLKQGLTNFKEGYISAIIKERTFNQISKHHTIYVDNKKTDGSLEGIILFDNKIEKNKNILFAKNAKIITSKNKDHTSFELKDGLKHSYDNLGNLSKMYFDKLILKICDSKSEIIARGRTSMELYINEMLVPDIRWSEDKKKRIKADGHARIIWPLFNFAFVFLGLSVFLCQRYDRKSNIRQIIITILPILLSAYFHFTLQKISYKQTNYIWLCYINVVACILTSIFLSNKKKL